MHGAANAMAYYALYAWIDGRWDDLYLLTSLFSAFNASSAIGSMQLAHRKRSARQNIHEHLEALGAR